MELNRVGSKCIQRRLLTAKHKLLITATLFGVDEATQQANGDYYLVWLSTGRRSRDDCSEGDIREKISADQLSIRSAEKVDGRLHPE